MVTECPSSDREPLPNETTTSVAENFVHVDIAGGELLFANVTDQSDTPDNPTDDGQLPIEEEDDVRFPLRNERRRLSPIFETDNWSVLMEDLSGSFLDNLPSDITDNPTAPSIPTIVFHRIGQSLDQDVLERSLQPEPQQVAFPPDLSLEESRSVEEQPLGSSRMHCCIYLVVVAIFAMCLSMKLLMEEIHIEDPKHFGIEDPKHFGLSHDVEIFVPTAVIDLTSTTQYPRNHPDSSVDGDSLMNVFDAASFFNMMIQSFSTLDNSKIGLFLHRTHLIFSSLWFTEWIQNLVARVCFIFSTVHFSASAVNVFSILSLGIVGSCLLVMFISSSSATQVPINTDYGRDTIAMTDTAIVMLSEEVLCENEFTIAEKLKQLEKKFNTANEEKSALNKELLLSEVELCFSLSTIKELEKKLSLQRSENAQHIERINHLETLLNVSITRFRIFEATASEQIEKLRDEYKQLNLQQIERVKGLDTLLKASKDTSNEEKSALNEKLHLSEEKLNSSMSTNKELERNLSLQRNENAQHIERINHLETLLKVSMVEVKHLRISEATASEHLRISEATASQQIKKWQDEYKRLKMRRTEKVNALETLLKTSKDKVKELEKKLCDSEATASEKIRKLQNDLSALAASRNASNAHFTQSTQQVESLCRFLQRCQRELSRTGRPSQVPGGGLSSRTSWLLTAFDKSAYERLTMEDLKLIGDFLGLTGLSTLSRAKMTFIVCIIDKYQSILQHLTMTDLMQVLRVLNVCPPNNAHSAILLKIIVETGF